MKSRVLLALVVVAFGLVPVASASDVAVSIGRTHVSTSLGRSFSFTTEVANRGSGPTGTLVAHLNILSLKPGVYVDPEDWSSNRTHYLDPIPPGSSRNVRWQIKAVNGGALGAYVTVVPQSGAGTPVTSHGYASTSPLERRSMPAGSFRSRSASPPESRCSDSAFGCSGVGTTASAAVPAVDYVSRVTFEHVLVVGAGQMGGGIAQVVAASGRRVSLHDAAPGATDRGLAAMRKSLERLAEKGGGDPDEVLGRVAAVEEIVPADLLIEAVIEDAAVKGEIFRRADEVLPEAAILASNTSSIPITSLAAMTGRPDRVIGMHFFNPVPVLKLVEVIRAVQTSDETAAAIVRLAEDLGKVPAQANDFPGFVSNRILMPFINEAAYALLEGVAEAEAIDTIAKLGFAHPLGPLALADLIGLDTCVAIMDVLHEGLGNPKYAPCPLLRQYVAAGRLGRKSGRGFYTY